MKASEAKEDKPEEEKVIQGEKPSIGNVIGVQKRYVGKKRAGISISALQNKKQEEKAADEAEDLTNKPRTPFTKDELVAKWKSFSYKLKDKGRQGLYITLSKRLPELKDDFQLEFEIDNEIQKIELEEERINLLTFLRSELNNYGISLKVILRETEDTVVHLSSKDKFLKMADKNPALHELRERMNLDVEY